MDIKIRQLGYKLEVKGDTNFSGQRQIQAVKNPRNMSEKEYMRAIEKCDDALSNLSSLPSETEEDSVAAVIKSS